jgi:hypothetical protein
VADAAKRLYYYIANDGVPVVAGCAAETHWPTNPHHRYLIDLQEAVTELFFFAGVLS